MQLVKLQDRPLIPLDSKARGQLRAVFDEIDFLEWMSQTAEEAADVLVCLEILREQGDLNMDDVLDIALQKAARWHGRIFKWED